MEKSHETKKTHGHNHHGKKDKSSMKMLIMAVALVLLIAISGVQAIQLTSLKEKMNEDLSELAATKKTVSTGHSSGSLSDNLNNLPSMVGGC